MLDVLELIKARDWQSAETVYITFQSHPIIRTPIVILATLVRFPIIWFSNLQRSGTNTFNVCTLQHSN